MVKYHDDQGRRKETIIVQECYYMSSQRLYAADRGS